MDCHVNGHTNGAFELGPDSRPNMARLRVDTPTMRGNFNLMQLSSKRSIRSMDHFSEVEEYFDGDPGMQQAIGPRAVKREVTNRMADFNAILDNPPAPKLDPLMRADPGARDRERAARARRCSMARRSCVACHSGPAFVDDYMHDLRVERFYAGRPEGPIKTFPLRGIKDTPAIPPRRPLPDTARRRRVLQHRPPAQALEAGEGRPRRLPALPLARQRATTRRCGCRNVSDCEPQAGAGA